MVLILLLLAIGTTAQQVSNLNELTLKTATYFFNETTIALDLSSYNLTELPTQKNDGYLDISENNIVFGINENRYEFRITKRRKDGQIEAKLDNDTELLITTAQGKIHLCFTNFIMSLKPYKIQS